MNKPEEIVRAACICAYNLDLYDYQKLNFPDGEWRTMYQDFGKWFCKLDSNNAKNFMEYALGGAGR